MFKHKRFLKILITLLTVAFVFSNFNLNANAAPYGTANVATGSGTVDNHREFTDFVHPKIR